MIKERAIIGLMVVLFVCQAESCERRIGKNQEEAKEKLQVNDRK